MEVTYLELKKMNVSTRDKFEIRQASKLESCDSDSSIESAIYDVKKYKEVP